MRIFILACFAWLFLLPVHSGYASTSLQQQIDESPPYGTISLDGSIYKGPVIISKPLTIKATEPAIIQASGKQPAITIEGQGVQLENIHVKSLSSEAETAVKMTGMKHQLRDMKVETNSIGIQLFQAADNVLENIQVTGQPEAEGELHAFNGIDLYQAHRNTITASTIQNVQDGIYVDHSHYNVIQQNTVTYSRYGIHLMFTEGTRVLQNNARHNITGLMIMESERVEVKGNDASYNDRHVHAQGLLVFNVFDSVFDSNRLNHNRVGVYLESSEQNRFISNEIAMNFIGLQVKEATQNTLTGNDFIANIVPGQAFGIFSNDVRNNYWDDAAVLDVNGDGSSELSHPLDPYFLTIVKKNPAYQLLFHAPGITLLKQVFKGDPEQLVFDEAPRAKPVMAQTKSSETRYSGRIWMSLIFLCASTTFFIIGRK
ncbi:NosD domain-containing protein [Siminovitchia sp. FSL W7-1587]|uniref:right-handed parallel beta-helix repeat-containing protein n=1 Tax=Siminovitchia sp. FSL W7-1587 TaxID=2954699 RepID=UPI0030CAA610